MTTPRDSGQRPKKKATPRAKKPSRRPEPLSKPWRIGAGLTALALVAIAILRASGPSGWAWVGLFGLGSLLGGAIAMGHRMRWSVPAVIAIVTGLWALSTVPKLAHGEGSADLRVTFERDAQGVLDLGALLFIATSASALALHLRPPSVPLKRNRVRFKGR